MATTGRPRKEIDLETFKGLCFIQCSLTEIAGVLDVSTDTVERWCLRELEMPFAEAFKKYSAGGKMSLRRSQFKLAEKNATMAIWLGKQYLGQRDDIAESVDSQSDILKALLELEKQSRGILPETEKPDISTV